MTSTDTRSATSDTLVVSEVFGPTIQGEGPSTGRRASFVRFGGCNLSCTWCDTAYTWNADKYDLRAELGRQSAGRIAERALHGDPSLVVLSGGEPLLHQYQGAWSSLLDTLTAANVDVEVETNGTVAPSRTTRSAVTRFNVSPKLAHSGDSEAARIRPATLSFLVKTGRAVFKFVCATPEHVDEAAALAAEHNIPPHTVWISPEGTDAATITVNTRQLADATVAAGFNLGTRLHVLAWGNERGR